MGVCSGAFFSKNKIKTLIINNNEQSLAADERISFARALLSLPAIRAV